MSGDPILYHDRYAGELKEEAVYGDGALRFAYETLPGRALSWLFFCRPFISRLFGWWMKRPRSRNRIRPFIEEYGLAVEEFAKAPEKFKSFNDFFCRELKPGVRPVDPDACSAVFPADGRHFGWPVMGEETGVFVKGQLWDLSGLLGGDQELVDLFSGGSLVLSRLCPVDYHHFHFPVGGKLVESRWLGQKLYSVSPIALRRSLAYLWQNKRYLSIYETAAFGRVCFIEVGATNVGSIHHRPLENELIEKGSPSGWFEFGGSSVITLFESGRIDLSRDLVRSTGEGVELYARVGDRMGMATISPDGKACPSPGSAAS